MNPLASVISWWLKRRMSQIELVLSSPSETQQQQWKYLMENGKNTAWGNQFRYSGIHSLAEYREQVPSFSYEDFFPWIERSMKGEENVLWPGKPVAFSKSSGTTNDRNKFIPVTEDSLEQCHYKGGKDLISLYLNNRPDSSVLSGKNLAMGGSLHPNPYQPNEICGDISAVIMQNLPAWAQWIRTPSLEIALLDKWEEKLDRMLETTLGENVTSLSGVPTWMLVLLNRMLEKTGKTSVKEIWPNLEVFLHGAVSFTPYREVFRKIIPEKEMAYLETYNASEGFFGIQDDLSLEGEMLLMLDYGIFYEFAPLEEANEKFPKTIGLGEVETGKNYALIISTNGGLWRYKLGDTIRFTSLNPFRIQVSGRTRHYINAFGEEVMVDNAELALSRACRATDAEVVEFTLAPEFMKAGVQGRHEWLIEFSNEPRNHDEFVRILDQELRNINADYDAKRYQDIALLQARVHKAPAGLFYEWMKSRNKLGGQHKVPRLSNSREYLEPLLRMASEMA
jgi:hypothetical protein